MKTLVIIPTFNEAENISQLIDKVLKQDFNIDILVIDDNSPDGTGKIVAEISTNNRRIHLIEREGKLGLGSAYITGFKYALTKDYEMIVEMDGDFSHNPENLKDMLIAIGDYDVVIGSRYIYGVSVVYWPFRRLLLSYFASLYVRIITGMKIYDPTAGFIAYRRDVLKTIDLNHIMSDGYSFQVEMKYRLWLKKFRIKEIPIIFTDRTRGQSKMSKKIVHEAIWMVWKLKFLAITKKL